MSRSLATSPTAADGDTSANSRAIRTGQRQGKRTGTPRSKWRGPQRGTAFLHTVIDDQPLVAYLEICTDERAVTAIGVLERAVAWFADHGVTVERVLSDNGSAYKSHAWRDACTALGITQKRSRPDRRPTAKSNDQRPNVAPRSRARSTPAITTASTPQAEPHSSADSTTCLNITPRSTGGSPSRLYAVCRLEHVDGCITGGTEPHSSARMTQGSSW